MSNSAIKFGVSGLFGMMGNNPSINALTNANAMAAQQAAATQINRNTMNAAQPIGSGASGMVANNDLSQMVMDASMPTFDPSAQMMGMGMFGARPGRNRSLYPSALMAHDKLSAELKDLEDRKQELIEEFGVGSDPVLEQESRIMDKKRDIEAAKKEHKKQ
tara:strand:+ start:697 stop:1179 length:483 start_codon:yes stop_codon:yes gene_type:complete